MAWMPGTAGREGRRRRWTLGGLLAACALGALPGTIGSAEAARPDPVRLRLVAPLASCSAQPLGAVRRPVMGVPVVLLQGGRVVARGRTDADGLVRLQPKRAGKIQLRATFADKRVSIHPANPTGRLPYSWTSKEFSPSVRGRVTRIKMLGPGPAGLASIWRTMQLAVRLGDAASPLRMPKARVAWEYDVALKRRWYGLTATFSDPNDNLIYVSGEPGQFRQRANDRNRSVVRHEWEMAAIAHEYGHLLLSHNAWPGNSKGSTHVFTGAYPDDPILPYDEGFANAFASMVMKTAAPTLNCEPLWDLAASPPTPGIEPADMARYAQHNEITVAAAVYRLTSLLGDGDQTAGLRKLLTALRAFEARSGRAPSRMRELHDAVLLSGVAAAPGKDLGDRLARIDGLFGELGMAWGGGADADFRAAFDDGSWVGTSANNTTGLRLDGPGGLTCVGGDDHSVEYGPLPGSDKLPFTGHRAAGGLDATWIDDCLGRVVVHSVVRLPHPFSADLSHLTGTWTISAFYDCTPGDPPPPDPENPDPHPEAYACRGSIDVPATVTRDFAAYELCEKAFWCRSGLGGNSEQGVVSIPKGSAVPLISFDAYGDCDLHPALLAAGSGYGCHL